MNTEEFMMKLSKVLEDKQFELEVLRAAAKLELQSQDYPVHRIIEEIEYAACNLGNARSYLKQLLGG